MGPIALFDSGEGGLTVLKRVLALYPGEDYLYVADSAHFPYGSRDLGEVRAFFLAILDFVLAEGARAVVVACNTATAAALDAARTVSPVPVVGVIEAGAETAARLSRNRRVGVLATLATCQSGIYRQTLHQFGPDLTVVERPCPLLVVLAENGHTDGEASRSAVGGCVVPLLDAGVDTIVLGCTHFPHMQRAFEAVVDGRARLVDPGHETAKVLPRYVAGLRTTGAGRITSYTTGDPALQARVGRELWPERPLNPLPLAWHDGRVIRR